MLSARVIPCLDVDGGRVVKGVQFDGVKKIMPISQISEFTDSNFHEIFLVDNTRSLFGLPPNFDALEALVLLEHLPY